MSTLLPAVVLGGIEWSAAANYPSLQTVGELARHRDVLYVYSEGRGTLGERAMRLGREVGERGLRRGVPGGSTPRRDGERLWLAPIGGAFSLLPLSSPEPTRRLHIWRLQRLITRWLAERGAARCDLVVYWWFVAEIVARTPYELCVYDCVDEHADYPGSTARAATVRRLEGRLMDVVDRIAVVSPALLDSRAAPGRSITVLPNAFDTARFAQVWANRPSPAADATIAPAGDRPLIGIVGGLGGRVDWPLLQELIAARPEWTFVFLGGDAQRVAPRAVAAAPNVRLLGAVPYDEAIRVMAGFTVGIIPFVDRPFTRGNSFLKLLDYLALALPVVATRLPDTDAVARDGPGLVAVAEGRQEWLAALDRAVAEPLDAPARAARRAYVEGRTVEGRVARLLTLDGREAAPLPAA